MIAQLGCCSVNPTRMTAHDIGGLFCGKELMLVRGILDLDSGGIPSFLGQSDFFYCRFRGALSTKRDVRNDSSTCALLRSNMFEFMTDRQNSKASSCHCQRPINEFSSSASLGLQTEESVSEAETFCQKGCRYAHG